MNNKEFLDSVYRKYNDKNILSDKFFQQNVLNNNNNNKVISYLIIICTVLFLSSSIIFADNFIVFTSKNSIGKVIDNGLNTALNNNYIQNVDMRYSKSNGINVKVNSISMDNSNIYILFEFVFNKKMTNNFDDLLIKDLIITDENNNIILCDDNQTIQKFYKENNINNKSKPYTSKYSNQILEKTNTKVKYLYILNSNKEYPKSKQLNINFKTIYFIENNIKVSNLNELRNKKGNWNIKLNLSESFYNRVPIKYIADNSQYINNLTLLVNDTDSSLSFEKNSEFNLKELYIYDSQNKIYIISESIKDNINSSTFKINLDLTKYNLSEKNNLTLHIKTDKFEENIALYN